LFLNVTYHTSPFQLDFKLIFNIESLRYFLRYSLPCILWAVIFLFIVYVLWGFYDIYLYAKHRRNIILTILEIMFYILVVALCGTVLLASFVRFANSLDRNVRIDLPGYSNNAYEFVDNYNLVNSYGLFRRMTTSRPEIVVQGSNDSKNWLTYEFKYKATDVNRIPPFIVPHQPRLDWQMWFAALGNYQYSPFFVHFLIKILQNSQPVLDLLETNPFQKQAPKYIRAHLYDYHFTTYSDIAKNSTIGWWKRKYTSEYIPVLDLNNSNVQQILKNYGWDKTMKNKNKITMISTTVKRVRQYTSKVNYYIFISTIIAILLPVLLLNR